MALDSETHYKSVSALNFHLTLRNVVFLPQNKFLLVVLLLKQLSGLFPQELKNHFLRGRSGPHLAVNRVDMYQVQIPSQDQREM